jgi:hypothetical protein
MPTFRQSTNKRATDRGVVLYQQQLGHNKTLTASTDEKKGSGLK